MATSFSDSFTDTDATELTAHTPNVGTAWVNYGTDTLNITSNRVSNTTFEAPSYATDPPAASDDCTLSATVIVNNAFVFGDVGLLGRWGHAADAGNRYEALWSQADDEWQLNVVVGGAVTNLGTSSSSKPVIGTNRALQLTMTGTTIILNVDGADLVTVTDATWSDAESCGIHCAGATEGDLCLDSFVVSDTPPSDPLVHSVSGRGNFAITGLNWLSTLIDTSSVPAVGNAEPQNYYHMGQLSWGTANGSMIAYPVTRMLDLVWIPSNMDTLWYSFPAGVAATITELSVP